MHLHRKISKRTIIISGFIVTLIFVIVILYKHNADSDWHCPQDALAFLTNTLPVRFVARQDNNINYIYAHTIGGFKSISDAFIEFENPEVYLCETLFMYDDELIANEIILNNIHYNNSNCAIENIDNTLGTIFQIDNLQITNYTRVYAYRFLKDTPGIFQYQIINTLIINPIRIINVAQSTKNYISFPIDIKYKYLLIYDKNICPTLQQLNHIYKFDHSNYKYYYLIPISSIPKYFDTSCATSPP